LPRLILMRAEGRRRTMGIHLSRLLIQHHIAYLFPGLILDGVSCLRVTRNSDLYIDDEEADNLLRSIEHELRDRAGATPCAWS